MCFFLCSGDPVEGDARQDYSQRFAVSMLEAPKADPLCCIASCALPCCAQIVIRRKALHYDMSKYTCCQGYMDGFLPCLRAGQCGESSCPNVCLCVESFVFNGCAVSATRLLVMDRHRLQPDEWDNRIIRFNNCIQVAAIICHCLAICIPPARDAADTMQCIAQCTYASTQGCMTAQVNVELNKREDFTACGGEDMERQ